MATISKTTDTIAELVNDVKLKQQLIEEGNLRFSQFSWEISAKEILKTAISTFKLVD